MGIAPIIIMEYVNFIGIILTFSHFSVGILGGLIKMRTYKRTKCSREERAMNEFYNLYHYAPGGGLLFPEREG